VKNFTTKSTKNYQHQRLPEPLNMASGGFQNSLVIRQRRSGKLGELENVFSEALSNNFLNNSGNTK
jgi:hypothetical protein